MKNKSQNKIFKNKYLKDWNRNKKIQEVFEIYNNYIKNFYDFSKAYFLNLNQPSFTFNYYKKIFELENILVKKDCLKKISFLNLLNHNDEIELLFQDIINESKNIDFLLCLIFFFKNLDNELNSYKFINKKNDFLEISEIELKIFLKKLEIFISKNVISFERLKESKNILKDQR